MIPEQIFATMMRQDLLTKVNDYRIWYVKVLPLPSKTNQNSREMLMYYQLVEVVCLAYRLIFGVNLDYLLDF